MVIEADVSAAVCSLHVRRLRSRLRVGDLRQLGFLPRWRVWLVGAENGDKNGAIVVSNGGFEKEERERKITFKTYIWLRGLYN